MLSLRKSGRLPDFESVVRRFPVATLTVAALTLHLMVDGFSGNHFESWIPGYLLGWYASVGVQLASESRSRALAWLPALKLALVAVALSLSAFHDATDFLPWLAVLAAVVFLGNAAWWGRGRDDPGVWLFTQRLWTGAIFATVGSVIFALGVLAIGATLDALFGVDLSELAEHVILPLGLAFLAPVYWMGTLPHPRELDTAPDLSFEARTLGFLGTWLLAPLVLIYGLIIVAYAFRVLLTWSLPDGETAILVTPFLVVGTLTWLVLQPTMLRAGALVRLYHRLWFPVALVSAALLAVAVWVRIAGYGLTPERTMLVLLTVAALVLGAWFTFTGRRDIRIPTAAAAGFLLAGSFLAAPVADLTQLQRLRAGLAATDKAAVARQVRSSATYLFGRADRRDWVRAQLPGYDPEGNLNLDAFLRDQGYRNPDQDRASLRRESWGSWSYRLGDGVDLSATPNLVSAFDVDITGDMVGDADLPAGAASSAFAFWRGDTLYVTLDGTRVPIRTGPLATTLFNSRTPGTDTETSDPVTLATTLPDGREATLVFTELRLNGEGNALRGGFGKALLFVQ